MNKINIFTKIRIILVFLFLVNAVAQAESFYVIKHKVKRGDSFTSILKKYVLKKSVINKSSSMIKVTISKNPHIKNWRNLKARKIIKVYISKQFINVTAYKKYKKKIAKIKKKIEKKILATNSDRPAPKKQFGMSIFYMTSIGNFTQTSDSQTRVSLSQNSSFTLGSLISFKPKNKKFFYSGSFYVSKLNDFESNVSTEKTTIPYEIGVNGYFNYTGVKFLQALYTGFDYEKFAPFNLGTIQVDTDGNNTQAIDFDKVYVLYLTAGLGKVFMVFNKAIFMKVSLSKSIFTSQTSSTSGTELTKDYTGFKSIFYMNYRVTKKFFVHGFYKIHMMSGPNDLTVSRYGVGFGMNVF